MTHRRTQPFIVKDEKGLLTWLDLWTSDFFYGLDMTHGNQLELDISFSFT